MSGFRDRAIHRAASPDAKAANLQAAAAYLADHLHAHYAAWFREVEPLPDARVLLVRTADPEATERWLAVGLRSWCGWPVRYAQQRNH